MSAAEDFEARIVAAIERQTKSGVRLEPENWGEPMGESTIRCGCALALLVLDEKGGRAAASLPDHAAIAEHDERDTAGLVADLVGGLTAIQAHAFLIGFDGRFGTSDDTDEAVEQAAEWHDAGFRVRNRFIASEDEA